MLLLKSRSTSSSTSMTSVVCVVVGAVAGGSRSTLMGSLSSAPTLVNLVTSCLTLRTPACPFGCLLFVGSRSPRWYLFMFAYPLRVFGPAPHLPQPCNPLSAVTRRFLLSSKSEIPAQNHLFGCSGWCPRAPHERPTSNGWRQSESERERRREAKGFLAVTTNTTGN